MTIALLIARNRSSATDPISGSLDDQQGSAIPPAMQMQRQALEAEAQRGVGALQHGDFATARDAFAKVTASGTASPQAWLFYAQACEGLDDRDNGIVALDHVLKGDVGSSRVDLQACKLEYSIVSPK